MYIPNIYFEKIFFVADRRAKFDNLISRGAVEKQAIMVGISSKGYWRLAKTYGSQSGLIPPGGTYLKEQGLVST